MKIESPDFKNNEKIPVQYTCDGDDLSPALAFSEIPKNTKSLVLIVDDPDVPKSIRPDGFWTHWIVWNIPPDATGLAVEERIGVEGKNTGGAVGYQGPCPPDREHRYFFRLFALDSMLDLPFGSDRSGLENAMAGHVIDEAHLIGRYERKNG